MLLGPAGSGKTTLGRDVARTLNLFHISFRVYLQEEILAKMKKPPLVSEDDWEGLEDEGNVHGQSKLLNSPIRNLVHVTCMLHAYFM